MELRDESQINKILAKPHLNLYDMIHSVFDRLSRDPEIDLDMANRLLAWVAFARRPLAFGELDVILRLGSAETNWFLWNQMRGKFASVFRLRYPDNWNAEEVDRDEDSESVPAVDDDEQPPTSQQDRDDDAFSLGDSSVEDFDYKQETTDDGNPDGGGDKVSSQPEEVKVSDADQLYSWAKKHTVIDFSHQHFRDFLVLEGDPEKRLKEPLLISVDVNNVHLQLVEESFKILRAAPEDGMLPPLRSFSPDAQADTLPTGSFVENYVVYPAFHIFSHLSAVDKRHLDDIQKCHILEELYWLLRMFSSKHV